VGISAIDPQGAMPYKNKRIFSTFPAGFDLHKNISMLLEKSAGFPAFSDAAQLDKNSKQKSCNYLNISNIYYRYFLADSTGFYAL
jgi:hypothetical protein